MLQFGLQGSSSMQKLRRKLSCSTGVPQERKDLKPVDLSLRVSCERKVKEKAARTNLQSGIQGAQRLRLRLAFCYTTSRYEPKWLHGLLHRTFQRRNLAAGNFLRLKQTTKMCFPRSKTSSVEKPKSSYLKYIPRLGFAIDNFEKPFESII